MTPLFRSLLRFRTPDGGPHVNAAPHVAPEAPGRMPLMGHAVPLVKDRLAFLQALRAHGPIVRIAVGPKAVTVINSPDLLQEMLTTKSKHFSKGLLFEKLKLFGEDALPVAEGDRHLARRRLMQPAFHHQQIDQYIRTMHTTVDPMIAAWQDMEPLDLKNEMQLMTQNVVMAALFSTTPDRDTGQAILKSVDTLFAAALRRALLPLPLLERLPTPGNRRADRASRVMRTAVGAVIADHRANPNAYDDIVSLLLRTRQQDGAPLADEDILSEVTGLLAAGSETTAVTLAWLFHELGRNPNLEEQLHHEVDTALTDAPLTMKSLTRLTFTRRLVNESLRLYSPAWLVTRRTTAPVRLGDMDLPAGQDIVWSPYTLHRDPALYPDPLQFDPDRWLPQRPQPPRGAFIPFGTGKRQCMGNEFALTEASLIAALVASRWRLRPVPGPPVRPVGAITLHPSELRMTAEPRTPARRHRRTA
ncbi:cytochrome P450 [Streptomyces anthocyanicus]|uniref:cytochrome P450 n=1 Tax=Streptomyces anthocyanicus TaxID=68174 RepID=UPI002F906EDD|nr:cytochrome P450 [Streptomyces anthocyanicus]